MAIGRVRAFNGASPQPSNHRQLLSHQRLQVWALSCHGGSNFDFGVQVTDALERFVAHPCPVTAHVLGQSLGSLPTHLVQITLSFFPQSWAHGSTPRELGRYLNHGLIDGDGHRVQIACIAFQSKPLRLKGERPATSEGIVEGW